MERSKQCWNNIFTNRRLPMWILENPKNGHGSDGMGKERTWMQWSIVQWAHRNGAESDNSHGPLLLIHLQRQPQIPTWTLTRGLYFPKDQYYVPITLNHFCPRCLLCMTLVEWRMVDDGLTMTISSNWSPIVRLTKFVCFFFVLDDDLLITYTFERNSASTSSSSPLLHRLHPYEKTRPWTLHTST